MKLDERAVLTQLNVSQPTMNKRDKRVSEQVAVSNNAVTQSGIYHKSLLPNNEHLRNVHKKTTLVRQFFYHNTLPWFGDGTMILPTKNYMTFMEGFTKLKSEWLQLVEKFLQEYPQLQLNAQRDLGSLYNANEYPSVDELRLRFDMDMTILPVPSNDFRVDIAEDELQHIQQQVEQRVEQSTEMAMNEAWQRLYDRVKHMAEKLSDIKNIFRDTLIENLVDVCDVLKRMNITDDEDLENIRQQVETHLTKHNPESLRLDLDLRKQVSAKANEIKKQIEGHMNDKR